MLTPNKVDELVNYWFISSQEKAKTAKTLYKNERYADCLFFAHLMIEKSLKALVVQTTKNHAPAIHNLNRLVEISKLKLTKQELSLLAFTNEFNMQARYPDEKLEFYKICNREYTDQYYKPLLILYKKLCQKVKLKK